MSKDISITKQQEDETSWQFEVETPAGTVHEVTLDKEYYQRRTGERISPAEMVTESFSFLLDQEPAGAIMNTFNLSVIETYFPAYKEKRF